jgi:hypothetical protein
MGLIKGSLTRDFRLQVFFINQCPPGSQVFHLEPLWIFSKIRGDTGDKLFSGVNDTGEKFTPVSLKPVNNLYFSGVIDIVQKKNQKA